MSDPTEQDDLLVTTSDAAEYLKLSPRTLERWRMEGAGPSYVVLGRKAVRYRLAALREFVSTGDRSSTSDSR